MTVTNKRELIQAYLKNTTIPLIDGTGDYSNTVQKVTRSFRTPNDLNAGDYPCICIVDDGETALREFTNNEYTAGVIEDNVFSGMPIVLVGYVEKPDLGQHDDDGELSTAMNNLYADMIIALLSDRTQGGNSLSTGAESVAMSLLYMEQKIGVVILKAIFKYDFAPVDANPIV
jgi:hypothetical protein